MKDLTIIIPFRNEREQVLKTCESFNRHCDPALFDILCIDDCSEAGYDYSEVEKFDNVTLAGNGQRLGVAGSRDKGVAACKTKYVLLVDGHMRVFGDVVTPLLEKLRAYPGALLCCQSKIIRYAKEKGGYEVERYPKTRGVKLNGDKVDLSFLDYRWDTLRNTDLLADVLPIQCCMGACYALERDYYLHLHGLNGLQQWGMDEQFLSAKVWMSGGKVLLLKNIEIAHIYREGTPVPYRSFGGSKLLNQLIVVYLLADEELFLQFRENIRYTTAYVIAKDTMDIFDELLPFLRRERNYLQLLMKEPFTYFLNLAKDGSI